MQLRLPTLTPFILDTLSLLTIGFHKWQDVTASDPESIEDYVKRNRATEPEVFFEVPGDVPNVRIEHSRHALFGFTIHDFSFPSLIITGHDRNDVVRGRLYEKNREPYRPVVILLHGWRMDNHLAFDAFGRLFLSQGYNALLLDLPYHMRRTPPTTFSGEFSFSGNAQRTLEAMRQSVIDIRTTINWLRSRGIPRVGLFGVSLGGLLTGLICCLDEDIDFGIPVVPPADFVEMYHKSPLGKIFEKEGPETRDLIEKYRDHLKPLSLVEQKPKIPKDRILIVEGTRDKFVPAEIVEKLWHAWDKPPIKRYRHGHLSVVLLNPWFNVDIKKFLRGLKHYDGALAAAK